MLPAAEVSSGGRIKWVEHPYDCNRGFHAETVYSRMASPNTEILEAQSRLVDRVRALLAIASFITHKVGLKPASGVWRIWPRSQFYVHLEFPAGLCTVTAFSGSFGNSRVRKGAHGSSTVSEMRGRSSVG